MKAPFYISENLDKMKSHIDRESVDFYLIILFPRTFNILKTLIYEKYTRNIRISDMV